MITYIYERDLAVLPFLIAPIAFTNDEAALVLGPRELATDKNRLLGVLYGRIERDKFTLPVIAQFFVFNHKILITNTIQTTIPDSQSGRQGLKLTYGALVDRRLAFQRPMICTRIFQLFHEYFRTAFGASTNLEGAGSVVKHFQQVKSELISEDAADAFLDRFAEEFRPSLKSGLSFANRFAVAIKALAKNKELFEPLANIEDAETFWRTVDVGAVYRLPTPESTEDGAAIRERTMNAGKTVPEGFRAYEDGKHRRYQLLFTLNGGAFAVAKLLAGKDASYVLGSLTLRQLAIGMILFTFVMSTDIFLFGRKMRETYLPDAFAWPGKLVLILIGTIICVGWGLVAR